MDEIIKKRFRHDLGEKEEESVDEVDQSVDD